MHSGTTQIPLKEKNLNLELRDFLVFSQWFLHK